ncbi:MAG TPA: hypothetical protein VFP36_11390, partial [Usitatibacter sp.]|nr:hypothetical protein [Usitatibacter sp.]
MRQTSSAIAFLRSFLLLLYAAASATAWAAPGDLISRTLQPFPGGVDLGNRIVVQADGKPIAIGNAT